MEDKKIQWQQLIEMIVVLMTILGSTIPLYMHTDSKLETSLQNMREDAKIMHAETREHVRAIQEEMKDFHTKLALQDQEFKMRLCSIEERSRG